MRKCEICGKGSIMRGKRKLLRGHYNPTGKTRKYPNLQSARTAEGKRVMACTNCVRTMRRAKSAVSAVGVPSVRGAVSGSK